MRRAGKVLREWWLSERILMEPAVEQATTVLEDWRACHAYALTKGRMGLKQRLATVGVEGFVGQRLKRAGRIVPKLARFPTMQLDTMQDIAGCRAIVPTQRDVERILTGWRVVTKRLIKLYDYASDPRSSGYRAVHLVVRYDERPVEVQLRTQLQHDWAYTVEAWSGRLGVDLKSGEGPAEALDFLAALSEGMSLEEGGDVVPDALMARIRLLSEKFIESMDQRRG